MDTDAMVEGSRQVMLEEVREERDFLRGELEMTRTRLNDLADRHNARAQAWEAACAQVKTERDDLALRLEETKEEAQNQRAHAHRALDERDAFRGELERVRADREELVTFANANTNKLMAELEDLRDRLAKAGARLSTVEGSRVEAQVEAEATTKAAARKVVDEVVDEALVALDVTEDWLAGMDQPGAFRRILEEARVRMTARISAIDDFSAEEPF